MPTDTTEQSRVQSDWQTFWEELITDKEENIDMQQVKKELSDYKFIMQQVPQVYEHITGGMLSKPMYSAAEVIVEADKHYDEIQDEEWQFFKEEMIEKIEAMMTRDLRAMEIDRQDWADFKKELLD